MGYVKRKKIKPVGTVKTLEESKLVWVGNVPQSNITRLMTEKEAKRWSEKTGQSVFTKMKKWELDNL